MTFNKETFVDCVAEIIAGMICSAESNRLLLTDIQMVPGFTVTCNISNIHAYLLTAASVSVFRKLFYIIVVKSYKTDWNSRILVTEKGILYEYILYTLHYIKSYLKWSEFKTAKPLLYTV